MILYLLVSTLSLCCVQRLKSIWHIFLFPSFHLFYPIFLSAYIFVLSLELEIWNWNLNGKGKKVLRPLSKFWFDRGAIKNFHLSFFYQLFLPWKSIKQQKINFFSFLSNHGGVSDEEVQCLIFRLTPWAKRTNSISYVFIKDELCYVTARANEHKRPISFFHDNGWTDQCE